MEPPAYNARKVAVLRAGALRDYLAAYRDHVAREETEELAGDYRVVCRSVAAQVSLRALADGGLVETLLAAGPGVGPAMLRRERLPEGLPARLRRWGLERIRAGGGTSLRPPPGGEVDVFDDPALEVLIEAHRQGFPPWAGEVSLLSGYVDDGDLSRRSRVLAALALLFLDRFRDEEALAAFYGRIRDLNSDTVAAHVLSHPAAGPTLWRRLARDHPRLAGRRLVAYEAARAVEDLRPVMRRYAGASGLERMLADDADDLDQVACALAAEAPARCLDALEARHQAGRVLGISPETIAQFLATSDAAVRERVLALLAGLGSDGVGSGKPHGAPSPV